MTETEIQNLQNKLHDIKLEHDDLDAVIARMCESEVFEDEQLHRLKKRKLLLKDQMVMLEHKLHH